MVMTSVILVVGFMVFCFSSSAASLRFGLLTAVTVLFAVLIDLIILPALFEGLFIETKLCQLRRTECPAKVKLNFGVRVVGHERQKRFW